ncbi:MAG TPA: glycosyl hydrolase [Polyangiaceae bacterium]|nr:glycosyl hydrolase [Polyangiaceae bacterium]
MDRAAAICWALGFAALGCGEPGSGSDRGSSRTGGASSAGGTASDGGTPSGGAPSTGGTESEGGAETSGGSAGNGGTTTSDGGTTTGGSPSSGGSPSEGGSPGEGGAVTSGGAAGDGGASNGGGGAGSRRAACKRGLGYGYHSVADLTALSAGVSWWYNWAFEPDAALRGGEYRSLDVQYVPMIWGPGSDLAAAADDIPEDATALLGFNEPNFGSQADLSAADAAARWPELEALADARGLKLVSPAVNFCGGDCQDTDPFNYLDEFFAACAGCRVDAIAIHVYVGCNPGGENHAEWLINHVQTYQSRFDLPLWLTEFACDSATSEAEQIAFLEDAVAYLEDEPRIERYAWFAGRADNMAHVDLLGADGELTALGRAYVAAPQPADCAR